MVKIKTKYLSLYVGFALVVASTLLARFAHFRHFYEFLLPGIFLVLRALLGARIPKQIYVHLYVIFIVAGLIGDLIMGIDITKLWHYNYSSIGDYIVLYAMSYPLAGIVMVQSYVLIKRRFLKIRDIKSKHPLVGIKQYWVLIACLAIVLALISGAATTHPTPALLSSFYLVASFIAFLLLSVISQAHGHMTVIEDLHHHPIKIVLGLLLAIYINAFIQEVPNTYAKEWVYTNYPLSSIHIVGIPLIMLIGWPVLLFVPVAAYYYIRPNPRVIRTKNKRYRKKYDTLG
jgi:hypothetical protein